MTFKDATKGVTVFITTLPTAGSYIANIRGIIPDTEFINIDMELTGCATKQILMSTIQSQLEEIFSFKYNYKFDSKGEDKLLYDGGYFQ